jgi:hypothetical protein
MNSLENTTYQDSFAEIRSGSKDSFSEHKEQIPESRVVGPSTSIIDQPDDIKYILFEYLSFRDLLAVGFTCKDLYYDDSRKKWMIRRVVDEFFYRKIFSLGPIRNWTSFIRYICPFDHFIDLYFRRLKSISIRDLERTSNNNVVQIHLNNNGMISNFSCKEFRGEIQMFPLDFISLELKEKKEILTNLFQYMYDLWKYAEEHDQDMDRSCDESIESFFDFFFLYESMEYFIKKVFVEDKSMRDEIMNYLEHLEKSTKDSKPYTDRRYDYFTKNSNQFDMNQFITYVDSSEFTDLESIIDIGEYLLKFEEPYTYHYLRERFDPFIDLSDDENLRLNDDFVEDFIHELSEPYMFQQTYKDELFELFTFSNYLIHEEFELALSYRLKRYYGEIHVDSQEEHDDYDY